MTTEVANNEPAGYTNSIRNVAVVGAGGQIGKHVVSALLASGKHNLTALTRATSKNQIPNGVRSVNVNYDDHESLVAGLHGQDILVISLSVSAPPETSEKLYRAAAEAKVPWVVPNAWGMDVADTENAGALGAMFKAQIKLMSELGLKFTGVACSFWYEFSLAGTSDRYGFDMPGKSVIFYDDGNTKIHTTTFPQVGRAMAALLSLPILPQDDQDDSLTLSKYENKFAHIASFRLSQKDMFQSVLRVSRTTEAEWKISYEPSRERFEKARAAMLAGDRIAFGRMLYAGAFNPVNTPASFDRYELDNKAFGLPEEDLDEFTKVAWEMAHSDYFEKQYGDFAKEGNKAGEAVFSKSE